MAETAKILFQGLKSVLASRIEGGISIDNVPLEAWAVVRACGIKLIAGRAVQEHDSSRKYNPMFCLQEVTLDGKATSLPCHSDVDESVL